MIKEMFFAATLVRWTERFQPSTLKFLQKTRSTMLPKNSNKCRSNVRLCRRCKFTVNFSSTVKTFFISAIISWFSL